MSDASARLDVLLYAHDGRGHGHVIRAVAIGLALRRVAPSARVLLVTGASNVAALEGVGELDWVKLPSRRARVEVGRIFEAAGPSNLDPEALGSLRGALLASLVERLRPRCALVDQLPVGKDGELWPALRTSDRSTTWLLDIRAVLGAIAEPQRRAAAVAVEAHYDGILWYGDEAIHGSTAREALAPVLGREGTPCGLVSRARELAHRPPALREKHTDALGTVSVPWCGPETLPVAVALAAALSTLRESGLEWRVYVGPARSGLDRGEVARLFERVPRCTVEPFGAEYLGSLRRSRVAIVYAGYNSIVDAMWSGVPTILVSHRTQEREQEENARLMAAASPQFAVHDAPDSPERWAALIVDRMRHGPFEAGALDGAERAACHLLAVLGEVRWAARSA